ncbi:MAG: transposase [Candidatus Omnitrophota bacterium]
MARLPRVYIESILYYVTSKGGNSQNVFIEPSDYNDYLGLVAKYKNQYGFKLFSYALLPAHLHLLIELKNNIGISNIMHDVNSLYTKIFNSKYGKKGHLFQERFKAVLAEKESHLLQLTRHIHLNPKRVKLVYDPADYPYSSHRQYIDPEKRKMPDIKEEIEEVFKQLGSREQAFDEYVKKSEQRQLDEYIKQLRRSRILGSEEFQNNIKKAIEDAAKKQDIQPVAPRKQQVLYMILGATAVFTLVINMLYFTGKHKELQTEYDKTLAMYERTLEMLKRERARADAGAGNSQEYAWKIQVTENALEELKQERQEAAKLANVIDGYAWNIQVRQTAGAQTKFHTTDTIIFLDNKVGSVNLMKEGFSNTRYTKRIAKDGTVTWETIQRDAKGGTVTWQGNWDKKAMRGMFRKCSASGTIADFSFVATGEGIKQSPPEGEARLSAKPRAGSGK